MGFGCPICSERLERLPAEAAQRAGAAAREDDVNIAATPCGHLFHTYCIQKWLSGSIASSKQCPCCRKPVPSLRILPLFPNGYEESILEDPNSQGAVQCDHSNFNITISNLRKQLTESQTKLKEAEDIAAVQSLSATELKQKYDREKVKSDHYLIQWKQFESYKDVAKQKERQCAELESNLKKFSYINSIIKGLRDPIENELGSFPPTVDSIKTLVEMKEVLKNELSSISGKLDECKKEQEATRLSKAKLQSNYDRLIKDYNELKKVYEETKSSPGFSPDRTYFTSQDLDQLMKNNQTRTPLLKKTKNSRNFNQNGYEIDNDVPLIKSFGDKAKKRNHKEQPSSSQTSKSSSSSVEMLFAQPENSSTTSNVEIPSSTTSSNANESKETYGRPPAKRFAFSKKTSSVPTSQLQSESIPSGSVDQSGSVVPPVLRKVSKIINCDVSPITPHLNQTINISSDDDQNDEDDHDVSQMLLRGNIPGMPVTPIRRKDEKTLRSRRFATNLRRPQM